MKSRNMQCLLLYVAVATVAVNAGPPFAPRDTRPMTDLDEVARVAHDAIWAAKDEYHQALVAAFPPGRQITYTHGRYDVLCEVVEVSMHDLVVRGLSGKVYRIDAARALPDASND